MNVAVVGLGEILGFSDQVWTKSISVKAEISPRMSKYADGGPIPKNHQNPTVRSRPPSRHSFQSL